MILKVYIKKNLFHLPRKQDDLTEMVRERFYKRKPLVKSGLTKLYRITDIESENIKYEKDVNLFLVNLYLLVLEHREELKSDKDITITLSNDTIISELSKKLNDELEGLSIEELEEKIKQYISGEKAMDQQKTVVKEEGEKEGNDQNLEVDFSISWVKAMDKKLRE